MEPEALEEQRTDDEAPPELRGPDTAGGIEPPEPDPYPRPPSLPVDGGSILDRITARRDEIARSEPAVLDVEVPGYEGLLVVRFRYPEGGWKVISTAVERAADTRNPDGALTGNIDVLLACVHEVLGRDPATGDLVPLDRSAQPGDPPLRFTKELAALLKIAVPDEIKSKGRFIARHVFSPRAEATGIYDGDVALMTTGGRVISWLQGERDRVDEGLAGE